MAVAVTMPQLGESVIEGTVSRWLKAPGETVTKLEPLLEISTDKIDTEVPAPAAGMLLSVLVAAGQTVRAGTVLAYIGAPGEQLEVVAASTPVSAPVSAASPVSVAEMQSTLPRTEASSRPTGRAFISPVVARMASEHQIDLTAVIGSGLGGRITKKDMLTYLAQPQPTVATVPVMTFDLGEQDRNKADSESDEWVEPLSAMRRAIAQHMVQSKRTSPHVTTVFEVDMTATVRHRETHKDALAQRGVRLTFTPYFVAAAAQALRAVPEMNARLHANERGEPQGIVHQRRVHIGVAVALAQGLLVPVIRDADERNLQGLARIVQAMAERARQGRLGPDETRGGTFTITNHGVTGSLLGTPIINQPQGGILGVGAIVKRPVVRSASPSLLPSADDAIVIRPMCFLSLTFDHRLLDGAQADAFMTQVVKYLETWPLADGSL